MSKATLLRYVCNNNSDLQFTLDILIAWNRHQKHVKTPTHYYNDGLATLKTCMSLTPGSNEAPFPPNQQPTPAQNADCTTQQHWKKTGATYKAVYVVVRVNNGV